MILPTQGTIHPGRLSQRKGYKTKLTKLRTPSDKDQHMYLQARILRVSDLTTLTTHRSASH